MQRTGVDRGVVLERASNELRGCIQLGVRATLVGVIRDERALDEPRCRLQVE
jgi:hypothetical protein